MKGAPGSLQRHLSWSLALSLLALGTLSGYATYRLVEHNLTKAFDYGLVSKARSLASLVRVESDGKIEFEFADDIMGEFQPSPHAEYFQIRDGQGTVIEKSKSLGEIVVPLKYHRLRSGAARNVQLPDGRPGRLVHVRVRAGSDDRENGQNPSETEEGADRHDVSVVVARERASLDRALSIVAGSLAVGSLGVALGGAFLATWLVGRGLRPLRQLAEQVGELGPDRLDARFSAHPLPEELVPIAQRLDFLFDKLRRSVERERRFSNDIAHELRTPLAEIRTALEVALRWSDDPELVVRSLEDALASAREAETLLTTLLELARKGEGAQAPPLRNIGLEHLIQDELRRLAPLAESRGVRFEVHLHEQEGPVFAFGHEDLARAVLRNLLSNAVQYAPESSVNAVSLVKNRGDRLSVEITNSAPDLTPEDLDSLCEPFWRKDAARTDRDHAGLGLAITRALVKLMGWQLEFELREDQTLVARLLVPLAPVSLPTDEPSASG